MSRAKAAVCLALTVATRTPAKSASPSHSPAPHSSSHQPLLPPHVAARPAAALPMLPSVARVRVETARDYAVVVEDVNLPRGDWKAGPLDVYVAFGAPGTPLAVDARLLATPGTGSDAHQDDPGEALAIETAIRRTFVAQPLLGNSRMAGVVVHLKESQLRRAYAAGGPALLRVRSLLPAPAVDADGAHGVVVRLGMDGGPPLTLGRIQLASRDPRSVVVRAEATLCGPDATSWPLSVSLVSQSAKTDPPARLPTIAPEMAVRHVSDDLCIRWWTES